MSMKKNLNTKKIAFKVVQIKSLAMHITNQKLTKYLHGTWCLLNILMNVGIKEKMIILTYTMYWLLTIDTNIPMLLMTGFVVQGHI